MSIFSEETITQINKIKDKYKGKSIRNRLEI